MEAAVWFAGIVTVPLTSAKSSSATAVSRANSHCTSTAVSRASERLTENDRVWPSFVCESATETVGPTVTYKPAEQFSVSVSPSTGSTQTP